MRTSLYENALQLLFPHRCAGCDQACEEGATFCRICDISVLAIVASCRLCALPTPRPVARCLACLARSPPFARAWAAFEFGGAVASAIRRLKWAGRPELARPLARLFPRELLAAAFADSDLVVPVPLHVRRLREREFNQAALLALAARSLGKPSPPFSAHALLKVRHTAPQASLALAQRRANVKGAFRADFRRVHGRRILLVDDVMTTGATAASSAEALLQAGAVQVAVLTVARAVP